MQAETARKMRADAKRNICSLPSGGLEGPAASPLSADISQILPKIREIVPSFHHLGNCIPFAAIRWPDSEHPRCRRMPVVSHERTVSQLRHPVHMAWSRFRSGSTKGMLCAVARHCTVGPFSSIAVPSVAADGMRWTSAKDFPRRRE